LCGSAATIALGCCDSIARWHTSMLWLHESDAATNSLMVWFVLALGIARLALVLDPPTYLLCGTISYVIEALFAVSARHLLRPRACIAVAGGSLAFAAVLLCFWP
jgi:hypothetical protein